MCFHFSKGGFLEFHGPNSGIERLMRQLSKINWTRTSSGGNVFVLVLVKRARTARNLANYLSNCGLLRGVKATSFAGYGGGSADNGETLFCRQFPSGGGFFSDTFGGVCVLLSKTLTLFKTIMC